MTWSPWTRKAKAKAFSFYDTHTYICLFVCAYWRMCRTKTKDQTRNLAVKEQKPSLTSTSTPPQAFQIARILSARGRERESGRARGRVVAVAFALAPFRVCALFSLSSVWPRRSAWGSDSHTTGESRAAGAGAGVARDWICVSVCVCVPAQCLLSLCFCYCFY